MQALYLESVNGNVRVKDLIEQLANLDREQHDKMVFEDTEAGWREAA
jgi:putative transcriptional regulator